MKRLHMPIVFFGLEWNGEKTEGFWLEWENGEEKGGDGREKGGDGVEGIWGKLWNHQLLIAGRS